MNIKIGAKRGRVICIAACKSKIKYPKRSTQDSVLLFIKLLSILMLKMNKKILKTT